MRIIGTGIVGSTAYGLNHANSDIDRMSVGLLPTARFLGLRAPRAEELTIHRVGENDTTTHELGKYLNLALKTNPVIVELLWLDTYEVTSPLWEELVSERRRLLSRRGVRSSYLGYMTSQLSQTSAPQRREKHGRHLYRLALQGVSLWRTGELTVRLTAEEAEQAMDFGRSATPEQMTKLLTWVEDQFSKPSPLSETADEQWADDFVRRART